jgi:hypothetical protein
MEPRWSVRTYGEEKTTIYGVSAIIFFFLRLARYAPTSRLSERSVGVGRDEISTK